MEGTRQPSRELGIACIAIGVVLALISGLAETVGIGGGTFGWKQVAGVIVGCLIAVIGLYIVFGPSSRSPNSS